MVQGSQMLKKIIERERHRSYGHDFLFKQALEMLLGAKCHHPRELPGHPFELGEGWSSSELGAIVAGWMVG